MNDSQGYGAADLSRRFGDGRELGVRVNIAHHQGDDSVDNQNLKLSMASLGADLRGEYDFNESAKVWLATGFRRGNEHNILSNPTSDPNGITRSYRFDNFRRDSITTSETGVRFGFDTGPVSHKISASGCIFQLSSKNAMRSRASQVSQGICMTRPP